MTASTVSAVTSERMLEVLPSQAMGYLLDAVVPSDACDPLLCVLSGASVSPASQDPVRIAPRVFLHVAGTPPPPHPPDAIVLPTIPSRAFGDGSHPTTRLCARAVDLWCRQHHPTAVLDVGTGTGVLARLARAHGARFVVGTDIDGTALAAARANAALDQHEVELVLKNRPPDAWGARFDLVVANILAGVLLELADALVRAMAPGAALMLSGFTPVQAPALRAAFSSRGLLPDVQAQLEGWAVLQLRRAA
ncbi:MAG: 50S ribosomal protein L11 methyltransferase [Myxococcota bacterium]